MTIDEAGAGTRRGAETTEPDAFDDPYPDIAIGPSKQWAVGLPGDSELDGARAPRDGSDPHREAHAVDQPEERVRLHELRVARPGSPQRPRVLRERREGGHLGGDADHGSDDVLGRELAHLAARQRRVLARAAGSAHRTGLQGRGIRQLRARDLGAGVRDHRGATQRARAARTRPRSTRVAAPRTRRRSSTSCSCGPTERTTCPTAPTCATSPPAPRWARRSASASRRSRTTTSRRPTS